ncbi:hypothetical protein BpHYR1_028038 [Brachionus plicatilis]|uniref:Uncharacterized protein n=1 Tax=Brachionus plicatilis TaxID=10195 RepID=A0A3M7Q3B9_BRAPC|nr:hypothetical protein BpHYR1_028038 [Brachionus plicatilis]
MANEQAIKLISLIERIVLGLGVILLVILLPLSFSYLDFNENGFFKRRTTSKVDTSKVNDGGHCPTCKQWELCDKDCKPRKLCTNEERGFYVEVRYLELQDIDIPLQVNERRLLSLIRDLEKEKEESVKEEMIVRKKSEYEVAKITNQAKEIVENAKAVYELKINQAETNYSRIIENEHNKGAWTYLYKT